MTKPSLLTIVLFVLVPVCAAGQEISTKLGKVQPQTFAWASAQNEDLDRSLITEPASTLRQNPSTKRAEKSIAGRVINDSGQPISNVEIFVRKVGRSASSSRSIVTDEDGKFRADNLVPGVYSVSAYVPGYVAETDNVDQQYYRLGETVVLRMIKGAVISGTVTNSAGEAVIAARVNAVRVRDAEGRPIRRARVSVGSRQTDDRGVYRLYGLQSGSYLIIVNGSEPSYNASSPYQGDVPTYYPSTTRDAAVEVKVQTGDEISGIEIRYRGEPGHIVSGTLSGSIGPDSSSRSISVTLTHAVNGALESGTYVLLRGGERGFALYGVPDGEYDLIAQVDTGTENAAASTPQRVTVKGSNVTGIDLAVAPLGSIAGRIDLEALPESERKGDCKDTRPAHLDEAVIVARRDEKSGAKHQPGFAFFTVSEDAPDDNGEFKISGLTAGRYRLDTRLLAEDWFVRSITVPGSAQSKQRSDVSGSGLAISSGQRTNDLRVTLARGAAALRGKVVAASGGGALPSHLRVHLVPAAPDSVDTVLKFAEAAVDDDGAFSISNVAPGSYLLLARAVSDEKFMEPMPRPVAWDSVSRAKLRRQAVAANVAIDLQRCQRVNDYVLQYSSPSDSDSKKRGWWSPRSGVDELWPTHQKTSTRRGGAAPALANRSKK